VNQPGLLAQLHGHFAVFAGGLSDDGLQATFACAGFGHGHGDAHSGAAGAVHPGVVGDGVNEV
jgi:outer membrane lipoprotein SlyB